MYVYSIIILYLYLSGVSDNVCGVTVHIELDCEEILVLLRFGVQFLSMAIFGSCIDSVTNCWYSKKYVLAKPTTSLATSLMMVQGFLIYSIHNNNVFCKAVAILEEFERMR